MEWGGQYEEVYAGRWSGRAEGVDGLDGIDAVDQIEWDGLDGVSGLDVGWMLFNSCITV